MGNKCPDKWFMGIGRFSVPVLYLIRLRVRPSGSPMLTSNVKNNNLNSVLLNLDELREDFLGHHDCSDAGAGSILVHPGLPGLAK